MPVIYRIQDAEGRGPFRPGITDKWLRQNFSHDDDLPPFAPVALFYAMLKARMPFYGCGCKTLEQLRRWLQPEEYEKLLNMGYFAVKMPVDAILLNDEFQVFFGRWRSLRKNCQKIDLYEKEGS